MASAKSSAGAFRVFLMKANIVRVGLNYKFTGY
jgi:hypothetical protein